MEILRNRCENRQHIVCAKFHLPHEFGTRFYVLKQFYKFTNEYCRTQNDDLRTEVHKVNFNNISIACQNLSHQYEVPNRIKTLRTFYYWKEGY